MPQPLWTEEIISRLPRTFITIINKMHYVYILQSIKDPTISYVGYTQNPEARLTQHNQGKSKFMKQHLPWELKWYCAYPEKRHALEFEKYLKSHSGKAFTSKRLVPTS